MIEKLLAACGLNNSEQKVLAFLAQRNSSTAGTIARQLHLKRPSVYAVLENLSSLGVVSRQKTAGAAAYAAISSEILPKVLEGIARKKYEQVKEAADMLKPCLDELSERKAQKISGFHLVSLDSPESAYAQFETVLLSGSYSAIFNPQTACVGSARKVVEYFLDETAKTAPLIREIAVAGPVCKWYRDRIQNPNHQVREIDANSNVHSDIIIIGDGIVVTHHEEGQQKSIQVSQKTFYHSMLAVFELLWESLAARQGNG